MSIWVSRAFLVLRVRVASNCASRAALCADDALEKYSYVLLAAREIKTPNEDRALRITFTSADGVRPQGVVHILRIVERSDRAFRGLIGSKICTVPKDNVDRDGVCLCVELMLYESDPLFICGARPRLWCRNIISFGRAPFRGAVEAVWAWRGCGGCRPLERDGAEAQGLYLCS